MPGRTDDTPQEKSLCEIVDHRAKADPDRLIFTYLDDGETETESFTYSGLRCRSLAIAYQLQKSVKPGDRVLLVYPPGLEFIAALLGCFYARVIAVPVYPPRFGFAANPFQPLVSISRDCTPAALLVGGVLVEPVVSAARSLLELSTLRLIASDQIDATNADEIDFQVIEKEAVALLQYTSGSTGDPKGVVITHGNILANEHVIQLAFHHRTSVRPGQGVCWLPFYHDMGLIGNILQAIYVDAPCYLMSPLVLLQRPIRWLQAITRYRAHSSGGPNFAYDLCVRRITPEQKATLDLSSWELAAIGAEPVSAATMDRFAGAFAECGFRREAFFPCYGLAEATLFVSGGDKEALPVERRFSASQLEFTADVFGEGTCAIIPDSANDQGQTPTLVGCGHAWTDHEIRIVNPSTRRECPENVVGEIWFRGPSVAKGYWQRPDLTKATFHAVLEDTQQGPYLRTGDLGFMDQGELFVSGRLKDLIVIRGHNHYPQDIEATVVGAHEDLRSNTGAAFGAVIDKEERLIIVQEIDRQLRKLEPDVLKKEIRRRIAEQHQIEAFDIVFLRSGTLPKTTSGKVRRQECRNRYLSSQLTLWTKTSTE